MSYNINMIKDARKIPKLKIFRLYRACINELKSEINVYIKLALVITIPAAVIGALQNLGFISDYSQYLNIAWAFAFSATIYFASRKKNSKDNKISTIYTAASGRILQFIGSSLVLAVFALPFGIGIVGLLFSLPVLGLPPVVFLPVSIIGLVLSGYLLTRFGLAQVIVIAENMSIKKSLQQSARITKKNQWKIFFGTLLVLVIYLVALTIIQFVLNLSGQLAQNIYVINILYVIEASIFMPIFVIYGVEMYKELNGKK